MPVPGGAGCGAGDAGCGAGAGWVETGAGCVAETGCRCWVPDRVLGKLANWVQLTWLRTLSFQSCGCGYIMELCVNIRMP